MIPWQIFYVDRVMVKRKFENRVFPLFVNWSGETLKEREDAEIGAGGFGGGQLNEPIVVPTEKLELEEQSPNKLVVQD